MTIRKSLFSFYIILLAVIMHIAVTPAFAEVTGTFTFVDGRVDLLKPGQDIALPVEAGAPVSLRDIIRTKSNSRAEITLLDGTVIRLAQGTRVEIANYLLDEDGAAKEGTLNLLRGKMRAISPRAIPDLQVLTPNATAQNIKGTDFYFIYEKGSTWFYGSGGTLQAASKEAPDQVVTIKRRNCVKVARGTSLKDSCIFNDVDEQKYAWDTAAAETVPVAAQLPSEGEVYTYTPLGGRALDTPSQPVSVASPDLTCPQCLFMDIPIEAATIKMGNFERRDPGCCEPVPPK